VPINFRTHLRLSNIHRPVSAIVGAFVFHNPITINIIFGLLICLGGGKYYLYQGQHYVWCYHKGGTKQTRHGSTHFPSSNARTHTPSHLTTTTDHCAHTLPPAVLPTAHTLLPPAAPLLTPFLLPCPLLTHPSFIAHYSHLFLRQCPLLAPPPSTNLQSSLLTPPPAQTLFHIITATQGFSTLGR
jgi:hypothetical protein